MAANHNAHEPQPLYSQSDLCRMLGNISQRKFKELQAKGVIPLALELGPRLPRWTHDDYLCIVATLPRRERAAEPQTLAQARRARIDAMKSGQVG